MCRLHDFHCFFPPARGVCSVTVTSVLGHCHSLDFAGKGANYGDPANLFGAHVSKVAEDTTAEHGIEAHLAAAAAGCTYLFLWLDCDREGELSSSLSLLASLVQKHKYWRALSVCLLSLSVYLLRWCKSTNTDT